MEQPQPNPLRFSLRTLLLITTGVAVLLGMYEWVLGGGLEFLVEWTADGLEGKSLSAYFSLWLISWYLWQIRRVLGNSAGTRWLAPACLGVLMLIAGESRALFTRAFTDRPGGFRGLSEAHFLDDLALSLYWLAFAILLIWLPRRLLFHPIKIGPKWQAVAHYSRNAAWVFSLPGTFYLCFQAYSGLPVLSLTQAVIFVYFAQLIAAALFGICLAIQLAEDRFPRSTVVCLIYAMVAMSYILSQA